MPGLGGSTGRQTECCSSARTAYRGRSRLRRPSFLEKQVTDLGLRCVSSSITVTCQATTRAHPVRRVRSEGNSKQSPFEASWELRCGPKNLFRILYDVDLAAQEVWILAIGIKDRNRLLIGEEEYDS